MFMSRGFPNKDLVVELGSYAKGKLSGKTLGHFAAVIFIVLDVELEWFSTRIGGFESPNDSVSHDSLGRRDAVLSFILVVTRTCHG